jgi:predicted nucleic-acid-binding protein
MLVRDDPQQAQSAEAEMVDAGVVHIPITVFVELVWVLQRSYRYSRRDIGAALDRLANSQKVRTDKVALHAGLAMLADGGDFADGVIASQGGQAGGETFVSFDRRAVALLHSQGLNAREPMAR